MTAVRSTRAVEQMLLDARFAALLLFDLDNLVAPPRENVVQIIRRAMKLLRADNEVHVRQSVNQLLSAALRHAAHKSQHDVWPAAADIRSQIFHLVESFLFRQVAHAARVQQNHVRDVFGRRQRVTLGDELGGDGFAVALVHLATVGFNIDTRHFRSAVKLRYRRGVWNVLKIIPILKFQALKEVPKFKSQSAPGRCLNAVGKLELGVWDFFGIWGLVLGACEIPRCSTLPHLLRLSTMQYPEGGEMDPQSDAFLRRLMRRQLWLAISCAVTFLIALLGLPLLNYFFPEAMATRVFGFTLTWFILGVLFFPFVWIISYVFIKRSIFLEEEEVREAKLQIPNSKPQTNPKPQAPKGSRGPTLLLLGFVASSFFGFWSLGFGV